MKRHTGKNMMLLFLGLWRLACYHCLPPLDKWCIYFYKGPIQSEEAIAAQNALAVLGCLKIPLNQATWGMKKIDYN